MANPDGQVVFEIQGDNKPLKQALSESTSAIQKESKNWDNAVDQASGKMNSSFTGALKSMAAAVAASKIGQMLVDFGKQAISAASDLAEVQNVVDVTFGESAAEIDRWAKDAINQFGLTETKAKQFASTMGAMLKSSGIASKDITSMSETLAGLAADMTSFYNLDFDEAFNKIRSGIAGETEPLKQLGINMSVANLEAFALSQGLKKTFNEMSQGEQIMLRYQYLMQATSDAQGDFAKTSDGFANGLRLLQSNFETLKTTIGNLLIPTISEAIGFLNDMLSLLIPATKQTTVLDDFADINLKTEQKLTDIEKTRDEALTLVGVLESIQATKIDANDIDLSGIAEGANLLASDASKNWEAFIDSLDGVDTLISNSDGGEKAGKELSGLAKGGDDVSGNKVTFKYDELPEGIKELIDNATGGAKAGDELEGLTKAEGLAGNKQSFKFSAWSKDVEELIGSSDGGQKAGEELAGLTEADKLAGSKETFKFSGFGKEAKEIIDNASGGEKAGDQLAGLATGAEDVAGTKEDFKFSGFGKDAKEVIDNTNGGTEAGDQLSGLADGAEKVAGTEEGFKFSGFGAEAKEIIDKSSGGEKAGDELSGLAVGGEAVSGTDKGFKFTSAKDNVDDLIKNADKGTEAGTNLENLSTGAEKVSGTDEGFKYTSAKENVDDLISASNGGTKAGTDLTKVSEGAEKVSGKDAGFKFKSAKDSVGNLIDASDKGTQAGTDLSNLAEGASAVANVDYSASDPIGLMARSIKILDSTKVRNWTKLLDAFGKVPGYTDKIDSKVIGDIAKAFGELGGDKAKAWETLMDALGSDLSALQTLTGQDENGAAAWLEQMKNAANGLNNDDVNSWNALLSLLANGTPGAGSFLTSEDMARLAQAAGMSEATIQKLGDKTVSANDKQQEWLETCRRLVQLLPELNGIINTETGEIKGGTEAVKAYVEEWTRGQKYMTLVQAQEQKRRAVAEKYNELPGLEVDWLVAARRVREQKQKLDALREKYGFGSDGYELIVKLNAVGGMGNLTAEEKEWNDAIRTLGLLTGAENQAKEALDAVNKAQEDAIAVIEEGDKAIAEEYEEYVNLSKGADTATDATDNFNDTQKKAAKDGVVALTDALKDMNDYIDRTRKSTEDSIDSTLKGFKSFETGFDYIQRLKRETQAEETDWLQKEQDNYDKAIEKGEQYVKKTFTGWNDVPTIDRMQKALESQTAFLVDYNKNLTQLQEWGLTDDFLAQFADMSQENAGYLSLMVESGKTAALGLQTEFNKMSEAKKPLVDSLTELKLNTDDEFQELVKKVQEAAENLDQSEIAKDSMAKTIEGIAAGISEHVDDVKTAVDALNAELARLGEVQNLNIFDGLNGGGFSFTFTGSGPDSNAKGLDYVPYNNYLSYLHEGEAVLTAEEARVWRNFVNGGANLSNTIDYGQLSGAIWDKAPNMGGNVYLDGATVGRVISAQQANSIRTLERSGWQG